MRSSAAVLALVLGSILGAGCVSAAPSPNLATAGSTATPSPAGASFAELNASPAAAPSASAAAATARPADGDPLVGTAITTLADDGLRVRSRPRIGDDSMMFEPLLASGTDLYVLDGPVRASGYAWYEVVPLASIELPRGWVASASREGVPWIAAGAFDCPSMPADVRSLRLLPPGMGPLCFDRVPITVRARLLSCNCDVDGAWYTPDWFVLGSGGPGLLVEPESSDVPSDTRGWFWLNLDPAAERPDVLPIGKVVDVTGIFDHPAAATCTRTDPDGDPTPDKGCRLAFAVTKLRIVGP